MKVILCLLLSLSCRSQTVFSYLDSPLTEVTRIQWKNDSLYVWKNYKEVKKDRVLEVFIIKANKLVFIRKEEFKINFL